MNSKLMLVFPPNAHREILVQMLGLTFTLKFFCVCGSVSAVLKYEWVWHCFRWLHFAATVWQDQCHRWIWKFVHTNTFTHNSITVWQIEAVRADMIVTLSVVCGTCICSHRLRLPNTCSAAVWKCVCACMEWVCFAIRDIPIVCATVSCLWIP